MDWEYQNNRGPVDVSSPFSQIPQRPFMGESSEAKLTFLIFFWISCSVTTAF